MKNTPLNYLLLVVVCAIWFFAGVKAHSAFGKAKSADATVYLCGTVEVDGIEHPIGVGVIDEMRLKSSKPADYKLRRQSTPCAGMR